MLRIFTISLFVLLLKHTALVGQTSLRDSLLFYEYAYFNSSDDAAKQQLLIKKIKLYLNHNITDSNVVKELKRVNTEALPAAELGSFLWNATLIFYLNNETAFARSYMDKYEALEKDTSLNVHFLSVLVNKYADTGLVNKKIKLLAAHDSLFEDLHCFLQAAQYSRKHLNFYLISSAILPGSGAIMNGNVLKGALSLALAAGSVYGIVTMVQYGLYINAVLWSTGVGLKFYTGNILLTEKLFEQKEGRKKNKLAQSCELKVKLLLDKYPLTLRDL